MAAKRRGPVLLELVKGRPDAATTGRPGAAAPPGHGPQESAKPLYAPSPPPPPLPDAARGPAPLPSHSSEVDPPGAFLSAGRTVRVPVGYFFFAAAGVVAIFMLGWALGHRSAEAQSRAAAALAAEQALPPINDSLLQPLQPPPTGGASTSPSPAPPPARRQTAASPARPPSTPAQGGDPRQSGLNYLIVARADPGNAEAIARFLQESGLEIATIPDNDARFHLVVATRGVPSGEVSGPEAARLKQEVLRLGRIWRRDHRGHTDFSDSFWKKHN